LKQTPDNQAQPNFPKLEINSNELEDKSKWIELGEGSIGKVYQTECNGVKVAVKELKLPASTMTETIKKAFKSEVEIMKTLLAPHVLALHGVVTNTAHWCLVMPLMSNGSLNEKLHGNVGDFPLNIRLSIAVEIAKGLLYLHEKNIVHRDLSSSSVLLDENMKAHVSGFTFSKIKNETQTKTTSGQRNCIRWVAPEQLDLKPKYSFKSDIHSFGMILWELSSRREPFDDTDGNEAIAAKIKKGEREVIPSGQLAILDDLIKRCWNEKPEERPTVKEAIEFLLKQKV